jgi:hypothetical protein
MNWRGPPLTSHEAVASLIGATRTATGLTVNAVLDTGSYPTGIKISGKVMQALPLTRHDLHGQWNYTCAPSSPTLLPARQGDISDVQAWNYALTPAR